MTVEEIANLDTEYLTAAQIAPILGANPDTIRRQAKDAPELLGFPRTIVGNRVRFPRRAFLQHLGVNV